MSEQEELLPRLDFSHEVRPCFGCNCGGPKVGSRGRWDSPIVVLGESPGVQEIRKGIPFIGPSGELLEKCWPTDLGVSLEDTLVMNSLQCFVASSIKDEARLTTAVSSCRDRVVDMIGAAPRKVIIALGRWANISVFGDTSFKMLANRGVVRSIEHPGRPGEECKVISVLHPAFLLRGQGNLGHFKSDLRRGVEEALGIKGKEYIDPEPVQLSTAEDVRQLIGYIQDLAKETGEKVRVASDIETTGFSFQRDRILCIGLYPNTGNPDDNEGWIIDWDRVLKEWKEQGHDLTGKVGARCIKGKAVIESELGYAFFGYYAAVKDLMELEEVDWGWHNGKFDVKFLREDGIEARIDEDSFLMSYALDERPGGHGLEEIAKNRLGSPNYKDVLKKWAPKKTDSYELVPKSVLWLYLARDVKNTALIQDGLRSDIEGDEALKKLYTYTLLPAAEMLSRVEQGGIAVDLSLVAENERLLEEEREAAQQEVAELAGWNVNPNSPAQVKDLLFVQLGLKLKGRVPTSTEKEVLDKLYETTRHPVLKAIRKYRKVVKALGTYVHAIPKWLGTDGRIHTTYNIGGTRTGRLSSNEPNIQNIPREARLRRMYCASEGKIFIEGDYNTAELRGLAAFSKDPFLTEVFLDGKRNLHDEVSIKMYGPNFTSDQRIRAKAINFGIPYGREAFSIAEEFEIATSEAQKMIDDWFRIAHGARDFLAACREAPLRGQTLVSVFGRKCRPGVVAPELLKQMQNEFSNFFMQSTISDFGLQAACLLSGVQTQTQLYAKLMVQPLSVYGARIVNLVHDSLLVEAPPEHAEEVANMMKIAMEGVPTFWLKTPIKFEVDFKKGTHWGMLEKYKV